MKALLLRQQRSVLLFLHHAKHMDLGFQCRSEAEGGSAAICPAAIA